MIKTYSNKFVELRLNLNRCLWDYAPFETSEMQWKLSNISNESIFGIQMNFKYCHILSGSCTFSALENDTLPPMAFKEGGGKWFSDYLCLFPEISFRINNELFIPKLESLNLESIEPIYDFRSAQYEKFLTNVNTIRNKHVLILGKDNSTFLENLLGIKGILANFGYVGILLKDFKDIPEQTVDEKLLLFASTVSFIILDDSVPSGHINELSIIKSNRITTAILRKAGSGGTRMQSDYSFDLKFIKEFVYINEATLRNAIENAVSWAQDYLKSRSEHLNEIYPWRSNE